MSEIVIRSEGLSKKCRIQQGASAKYDTLRESLVRMVKSPLRLFNRDHHLTRRDGRSYIWALKDISFEIEKGEVIGIIGHNGAGKTTLLKILSRITEPTEGRVEIDGRVGSLLEVGTGFHPELTGRENLYMNGAILGMKKIEIDRKLDEIVAFAGLEEFSDTPVKYYSTGMYIRLAFAVAAHLEQEILLVDEVLAVGDAEFQKKCLGKLDDVAQEGRTVLFVSHNMGAVQNLCSKVFLLKSGHLVETGKPSKVIGDYLKGTSEDSRQLVNIDLDHEAIKIKKIVLEQDGCHEGAPFRIDEEVRVQVYYTVKRPLGKILLGFDVISTDGFHLFRTYDAITHGLREREPGEYVSTITFHPLTFQYGTYYLHFILGIHNICWITRNQIRLRMTFEGAKVTAIDYPGSIQPQGRWDVLPLEKEQVK
jgi:homopolymeric O-antigen transport system ATP-binding protein